MHIHTHVHTHIHMYTCTHVHIYSRYSRLPTLGKCIYINVYKITRFKYQAYS